MTRPDGFRLSQDLQDDLVWYWTEAESALGVRSTTGSQIVMLQSRAMPDAPRGDTGLALERWRLGGPEVREAMRKERWEREDQAARAVFQTMQVGSGSGGDCTRYRMAFAGSRIDGVPVDIEQVTYEPDWAKIAGGAAQVRQRSRRVWGTLRRMKDRPGGPQHEFVLYRVYGPKLALLQESKLLTKTDQEQKDLGPLFEYTPEISRRFDGGVERRRVLELALRNPSPSLTRVLRAEAQEVLEQAWSAYSDADAAMRGAEAHKKRQRFLKMMQAA